MKYILIVIFSLNTIISYSQSKHVVTYKADLIKSELIQNYAIPKASNEKIIQSRVIGIEVLIEVDTVFKKYTVWFTDDAGRRTYLNLSYNRDVYPVANSKTTPFNKIYYMTNKEDIFLVTDYMELIPMNYLKIQFTERYPDNCTLFMQINNVEKVH